MLRSALDYLDVLCGGDADAREYLIEWLSHLLKYPNTKPRRALALVGRAPSFLDLLSQLVPIVEVHDSIHADWRSLPSLESARVVVAHPPNSSSKLRALLSADVIERRRPQQPSRIVRSFHRVLIISGRELWEGERSVETIVCTGDDAIKVPTLRAVEALRGWLMRRPVKEERFL